MSIQSSHSASSRSVVRAQEDPMKQLFSTSVTRRKAIVGLALTAAPVAWRGRITPPPRPSKGNQRKVCTSGWAASSPSLR